MFKLWWITNQSLSEVLSLCDCHMISLILFKVAIAILCLASVEKESDRKKGTYKKAVP